MTIHPFRPIFPNFDLISSADTFFTTVKHEFPAYWKSGFFQEQGQDDLFVYEITGSDKHYLGVIACTDIRDYLDGRIKCHEETLPSKEKYMMNLVLEREAMIKPVLLTYPGHPEIEALVNKIRKSEPIHAIRFLEEKQTHSLYAIKQPKDIVRMQRLFKEHVQRAYIADGHHRSATSAKLYHTIKPDAMLMKYDKLLCVFLPFEQLVIHDYNRVIEILHEISPTVFLARISRLCHIQHLKQPSKPRGKHEMTLYLDREWYRLRWKKIILKKYKTDLVILDGAILNKEILRPILDIEDVRNDLRLHYVEGISGIEGVIAKAHKNAYRIGFCIYPVAMDELVTVADNNQTLPPKSTWFEPRVKNGLIAAAF